MASHVARTPYGRRDRPTSLRIQWEKLYIARQLYPTRKLHEVPMYVYGAMSVVSVALVHLP